MTKKRLLSAFLSLCMVFSMVPAAFAEGETENQASMEQSIILSDETGSDVDTDENQNDSETPLNNNSVAKIDSENALLQAIDAAESGATIKLSGNVVITKTIIIKDKTLTLDLSGYTITAEQPIWKDPKDPSDSDEKNWSLISVRGSSNVTIKGNGKLQALKNDSYAVDVYDENSICTIKSGTFVGNISAIYVFQGKLIIEGGTFSIQQKESGKDPYRFLLNCYDKYYKDSTASITVKGGTFKNFNPADCLAEGTGTNFCAAGHKSTPTADDSWTVEQLPYVAAIGDKQYYTLAEAVTEAKDGDTITMVNDAQLSSVITIDKAVTLDLNGKTITAADSVNPVQVLKQGELTIKDSAGQGAIEAKNPLSVERGSLILENGKISVKNTTNGYGIYVSKNGSVTVNGGEISSTYAPLSGNNTTGDMNFTVNGGTLTAEYGPAIYMPGQVNLTITDGTLNGGISLRMGQVNISGGTINATTNDIDPIDKYYKYSGNAWLPDALYVFNGTYISKNDKYGNSLNLNITGGTFTCENSQGGAITIYDLGKVEQKSSITISGEAKLVTNAGSREAYQVLKLEEVGVSSPTEEGYGTYSGHVKTVITGGMFTKQPDTSYIANGYVVVNSGDANYPYLIQKAEPVGEAGAVAEVADPSVDDSQLSHLTEDQQKDVVAAAESVEVSSDVMQEQSKTALDEVKEDGTIVGDAVQALKTLNQGSVAAADVTLFVQAYLNITPTEYNPEETTLTFDITPMSRIVASTKDVKDSDNLVIQGEQEAEDTPNAVVVGDPKELDITDTVEMTIQLPSAFSDVTTAYVVHTKGDNTQYLYDGQVANNVLTFTNPNGFSDFTVYGEDPAVARVYANGDDVDTTAGTGFLTLQEAVDAVLNGGYIVVKQDGEAVVSESKSFTVQNEDAYDITIEPGRRYEMTEELDENGYTVYTFTSRSGGTIVPSIDRGDGIGTPLPEAGEGSGTPSASGFTSDTNADLTVDGRYQFRITSLDGHTPVLTVNNSNFTVALASQNGRDYFYVITCAGTPGSTAAVSVDGKYLLTATVGGSASGVVSDTTHPFTVAQGGTYQFRLTAAARPSFAAGSASFTVEYAGQEGNDYFYKVHAVGQAGDGCGFYINGEAQPVAVATIA